ncbi:choline/ethanolamine kinase-like protein [Euroglyphus maynei]|uniref:Choline/ethanolamine kinase-like protein n=1 Tax=Euroglyphus maynei TaxID=6958 RepID=A0A1Y3BRW6_EURMA|nr:choline/ethanolamine kinase-like protein [Euroglyphus maynei]
MMCNELSNPLYSSIIARKLAIVHHLNVPINKEPTWLPETMEQWLKQIRKIPLNMEQMSTIEQELIRFDYENEIIKLFRILNECESPVVFSNHFIERMFDYSNPEWPHYFAYMDRFPAIDNDKRLFIREYLKQCSELNHNTLGPLDNEEHLFKEIDLFALASHLLWTLWSINNARTSKISFGYLVRII